ncbi:MAG: hypothetical protein ACREQA_16025 [Candidatus Binatia bacterium]
MEEITATAPLGAAIEEGVSRLYRAGYTVRTIADSLDTSVSVVQTLVARLGLRPQPVISYEEALRQVGCSEGYIAHVTKDEKKRKVQDVPQFDCGSWGALLGAEADSHRRRASKDRAKNSERFCLWSEG